MRLFYAFVIILTISTARIAMAEKGGGWHDNCCTVCRSVPAAEESSHAVLVWDGNSVHLYAAMKRSDFKKFYTLNPAPVCVDGSGNDLLPMRSWMVDIPGKLEVGSRVFVMQPSHGGSLVIDEKETGEVLPLLKAGKVAVVTFSGPGYPNQVVDFSLVGFTAAANSIAVCKDMSPTGGACKKQLAVDMKLIEVKCLRGKRVIVNTSEGSFAVNGTAIGWVERTNNLGVPVLGVDMKPIRDARDYFEPSTVQAWISDGLSQCQE